MSCWTALRSLSAAAQVGILFTFLPVQSGEEVAAAAGSGGSWQVVVQNAGIASMHGAVTHYGKVVVLDRTNIDPSQLPLPPGVCRNNPQDRVSKHDCTAHSAVYTPGTYNIQPLSSSPTLGALPASSVRMELWCRLEEMPTETARSGHTVHVLHQELVTGWKPRHPAAREMVCIQPTAAGRHRDCGRRAQRFHCGVHTCKRPWTIQRPSSNSCNS
ncbi:unnamed protein product [Sphagnum troendelagicum]|uniref:Glyoxal oxidase N-terminal domain-containing protein n=1 Tax=Sphagnum troendelagicum TaxID=128251 RepID=A0ABP0TVR3_9BRYO